MNIFCMGSYSWRMVNIIQEHLEICCAACGKWMAWGKMRVASWILYPSQNMQFQDLNALCHLLPYELFAIFLCIWIASCNLVANFYQLLVRSLCIWMLVAINRVCNFFPYQLQGNPRQSLNNLCIWFRKLSESRCVIWVWYWACSSKGFWSKQAFVLARVIYCFLLLWLPALTLFPLLVTNSYFFSLLQLASPLQLPKQNLELESQLLFLNYLYT